MKKKLFLLFGSFTIALVAVEIALRCLGYSSNTIFIVYDKDCLWRTAPNQNFWFRDEQGRKVHATINSAGARGPEISTDKAPGVTRVVFLGDSYVYGWGVDDASTLSASLEQNAVRVGKEIETLNFGCNGHTILQEVGVLKKFALQYKPDYVLVAFNATDFKNIDEIDIDLKGMSAPGYNFAKHLLRETALGNLILSKRTAVKVKLIKERRAEALVAAKGAEMPGTLSPTPVLPPKPKAVNVYLQNLEDLNALAQKEHFQVIYVMLPWMMSEADQVKISKRYRDDGPSNMAEFRKIIERQYGKSWHVISLMGRLKSPDLFLQDGHLSADGNKQAARMIYEALW